MNSVVSDNSALSINPEYLAHAKGYGHGSPILD
jgi:hypothetical protein